MSAGSILVVDDDPQIRRVMRATLTANGYEVQDAHSGEQALQEVRNERHDLILLDVNMPGIGGLQACREIREVSDISIIMLTVRNTERDKVEALDAGADDYVAKPFSIPELLARIRAALRRTNTNDQAPTHLVLGKVQVDFQARLVILRDRKIRLTPKEFDLLHYLYQHPNRPIPHRELLQAVWGPDYGDEVEYLRVFINQLRKKVELDPAEPQYILTEPWLGYRLVVPSQT